ncbi:MAG TPA: hypothetical protein VGN09_03490 [Vicinamibacteria bacterium]
MSLFLILAACVGGAAATYLFDDDAPLVARLAVGGALGLAVFGLAGFVAASLLGLGPTAVAAGILAAGAPLLGFADPGRRRRLGADARAALTRPGRAELGTIFFYVGMAVLVWQVTERAVLFEDGAIGTGVDHNLGDLPFHVAIISGFAYGQNLPPEHPELAGVRLTYPFLVDFIAAMMVRAGGSLRSALFLEGLVLGLCIVALLHRWSLLLTGDRLAAVVSPALFLLNGGLGWTLLLREVTPGRGGLGALLSNLPHNYTILPSGGLRWGNVVTTLLVPQRTLLLGLPLALAAATLWWQALGENPPADRTRARRRMAGAGVIAGLLPLVHGHSFAVVMAAGAALALLFPRRIWTWFFAPAVALALPQVLWMAAGTGLRARSFVGWHLGWDHGEQNVVLFWLRNTGLFIPLLVATFGWRRRDGGRLVPGRLARFYVPFALCFIVPNLLQLSPWIWDNVKFLVYWLVASTPIVALLIAHWWRRGGWRSVAVASLVLLTLAGGLDVWRVVSRAETHAIFDADAVSFAGRLREATPPRALVLHVPTYRSPVFLAGRRSLLGYPGHIWSQGLDAGTREADIARMYRGGADARELMRRYGVDCVMYGPEEAAVAGEEGLAPLPLIVASGRYRLYDAAPPKNP